ncbi:MAG: type IV pilus assembly protein PilM [Candidatus Moranbacteria bacterium]|nr:type IV pilus assembly protein PilM [Candidatus Moranbacteria bacterium]
MSFLNKEIIGFQDKFFGLDLSDISLKAFYLDKKGEEYCVGGFVSSAIPEGYISDGTLIEKEKVASIIKAAIKKAVPRRIHAKGVVCSLPESKVFLRKISMPKMDDSEISEAIKWEIEESIPLSADQVYYDWQIIDESDGKLNILTVAVAKETVDDTVEVLEMAGLNVFGLEVESVATARSLIPRDAKNEDIYFIADLGAKRTSFIITEGNVPYFTSSIPFSSEGMTDIISKAMGVDDAEAERMKISKGIGHAGEAGSLLPPLESYLENLSGEIEKTLDFYHSMTKSNIKIKKVILSGGGSNLRGLVPYMTKILGREVVLGDPWTNIDFGHSLPVINKEKSSEFSTAIGLAMRQK